jgi:putative chitinase
MALSREQLMAAMPALRGRKAMVDAELPYLNDALEEFGITTERRIAAFLAQMGHESVDFTKLTENLNYSAKRLREVFPKYFTAAQAAAYAGQPERIANRVYANRMGNGPESSGDGWRFRGNGITHLTGRKNHEIAGKYFGVDFVARPDLVRSPEYKYRVAGWYWKTNGLNELADRNAFEAITRRINGGLNGQPDRLRRWAKAKAALADYDETKASVATAAALPATETAAGESPSGAQPAVVPVVAVAAPAVLPVEAVPGGGIKDDAEKANNQSLVTKIWKWVGAATGGGTIATLALDKVPLLSGFSPEVQLFIVKGVFAAALLFGVIAVIIAAVDHLQTKYIKARPDLQNTK